MICAAMASLYLLFLPHFRIDYNIASLLLVLIMMYYEIKRVKQGKGIFEYEFKSDFGLGLLIGTSILFKQTTGLVICAMFVIYKLFVVTKKEEFKAFVKIMLVRSLGVAVPVIMLAIYLTINNIWTYFLDFAVFRYNYIF